MAEARREASRLVEAARERARGRVQEADGELAPRAEARRRAVERERDDAVASIREQADRREAWYRDLPDERVREAAEEVIARVFGAEQGSDP